ncbi:arabinosyltransferase C [Pseudonocardia ammonioxydans]|uniref:Arabinosyltransferase C n=1 Tax=Pseudonocardia ammonioxydans TaxID=260086 RepID=A0A1I4U391_PSUAM|nr:arabinosyltransferase domain-containing protein [Pseudonocardia ammonioxydans]SFM83281.1 arabinosyltransferase C [Pseudonocardia ammonioxydans]
MLTEEPTITQRDTADTSRDRRRLQWAGGLGLLAFVLAVAVPFLPVVQHENTIVWPSPETGAQDVNAPLVALRPESMSVTIPADAIRSLDDRSSAPATVLSTVPPESPEGARSGMALSVADGQLLLINRGQQLSAAPVREGPFDVRITSDAASSTVDLGLGAQTFEGDLRPQSVGVYSDLDESADPLDGAAVRISPDTRFDTSPSVWKSLATVVASVALVASLLALAGVDRHLGRRPHRAGREAGGLAERWPPRLRRWWTRARPRPVDLTVTAVLGLWAAIGTQTTDDGFTLGIVRNVPSSGYVGNYYRWYNAAEAPFGWFYDLYALWVQVSDSLLWLRLPSVLMAVTAWWLVSRGLLPRLGRQGRRSRAATWAAAAVFLAFWMAYNSGLRPEPVVVVCSLLALVCVERAIALQRVLPVALGLFAASMAVGANPAGLIAVAPFLAGIRPLWHLLATRVRAFGVIPVLAPLLGAGTAILMIAWADQSWAAVVDSTRLRSDIGPDWEWYTEIAQRYAPLFGEGADGSIARRFPVLLVILCILACVVVLIRRSRIPGAALGPAQRLIGSTVISLLILAMTPTKWTHHFGDLVGLGSGIVALAAIATGSDALRSLRNRLAFLSAAFLVAALSAAGPNMWWYTNNWGVPWAGEQVTIGGYEASTLLLVAALLLAAGAGVEHLRGIREERHPDQLAGVERAIGRLPLVGRWWRARDWRRDASTALAATRRLRLTSAPLAVLCGLLVTFNLWSVTAAMQNQAGSWSMGADALSNPFGGSCGLASQVYAERRPVDGVLPPAPEPSGMAPPADPDLLPKVAPPPPPGGESTTTPAPLPPGTVPANSPEAELRNPASGGSGFHRDGVPPTGGGSGVSGFEYVLSGGLGTDAAPAFGSFDPSGENTGVLRTPWASLTDEQRDGTTPLVVTAAGRLGGGNKLTVQYATRLSDGRVKVVEQTTLDDGRGEEMPWRELRFDLPEPARAATEVRLVAQDNSLGADGWLAVAPIRAPQLAPLSRIVGEQPMFLEYPVSLASPCLRPFETSGGIAEIPAYRLQADGSRMRADGEGWSAPQAGGPLGWITVLGKQTELPTYLEGDPGRDWGKVQAIQPYRPNAVGPTLQETDVLRSGLYTPGPLPAPPPGIPSPSR